MNKLFEKYSLSLSVRRFFHFLLSSVIAIFLVSSVPAYTQTNSDIHVTVTNTTGAPEVGLSVLAYDDDTYVERSATTDSSGVATLTVLPGSYRFRIRKSGMDFYTGESNHCSTTSCTQVNHEIEIPASIAVTVTNTTGAPEVGLSVLAYDDDTYVERSATTDSSGVATLTVLPGSYRFRIRKSGMDFYTGESNHCSTTSCTQVSHEIEIPASIAVTVTNTTGAPEAGLSVLAYDDDTYAERSATTDSGGVATLTVLPGSYRFRIRKSGMDFYTGESNHCSTTSCTQVSHEIEIPASIAVTVTNTTGAPEAGLSVLAYDDDTYAERSATTDSSGVAALTVLPGSYRFRIIKSGTNFYTSETNHCSTPSCTQVSYEIPGSVVVIEGDSSDNILQGTEGDDLIYGYGGNDTLYGNGGDDIFILQENETGFNRFYGGDGFDQVIATAADDVIGIERFHIVEGSSVELIDGKEGYNIISAEGADGSLLLDFSATQLTNIAEIHGGAGNDTIRDNDDGRIIVGGLGGDILTGNGGDDTLIGGGGNDTLYGGAGDDTFQLIIGETGFNRFYGGDGFDQIIATAADDVIGVSRSNLGDGSSVELIDGGAGYNIISAEGQSGNHWLDFSATQLTNIAEIHGGSANDSIYSGDEGAVIVGGLGVDNLYGNGGDDTYRFGAGDGQDLINDESSDSATSSDRLEFIDIAHGQLWFSRIGTDLRIRIVGSDDQVSVDDWYRGTDYQLDEIYASDGGVLVRENVDQLVSAMAAHPIPESVDAVIPQSVLDVLAQTWSDEASTANVPPVISITSPSANAGYTDGDSVSFTATASDSEDGDISTDINWSSDLDGSLGSGAGVNVSTLSVGTHIITVAVVDSASAAANDSIVVTVVASLDVASVVYVSDMPWVTETNGWGVAERDRSNGELAADDGNPITLDGVVYAKGIGAHANSEITVELNGDYEQFTSMVGLDDEMNPNGSVVFEVYGDDQPLFQSSVHVGSTVAEAVDISVAGVNTLRLVITDAGNGNAQDHADWADAQLHLPSGYSAPDAIIVAPVNNSVTSSGETLILVGSADDAQDGDVSSSLQWTSNLDGLLGAGTSLSIGTLSIGQHTITATATDSDGTVGNAVITLTVAATPVTPKALISASGSAIVFNEAVSSPSGRLGISNIAYEQLWFSRSGNDLQIDVVGSDEQIIINGWYLGSSYQFDGIEASDGRVLARDQVDQLVNTMAVFAIPEGVGAVIPQSTLDNLLQVWPSVWISSP